MIKYSNDDSAGLPPGIENPSDPDIMRSLELRADEVHVWIANLNEHSADRLKCTLAEGEVARADRFRFTRDRHHYIVARALLRKLLAAYLDASAAELQFTYAEKGKPSLQEGQQRSINFNLAHSHGLAVYAFTRGRELGIDLEFIREDLAEVEVAERFFSPREIEVLTAVPADLRREAFFNCWTRKEAYIKARGEGLSMPLDEFDVSFAPGEEAALLGNHREPAEVLRWRMLSVAVPVGYVAALVAEGHDWRLQTFCVKRSE